MDYRIKKQIKRILFGNSLGQKMYSLFAERVRKKRSKMTDEEYVKLAFKENTGCELDLVNPKTYNDKLLWLSLYDRNELKTLCADKYAVRGYVEKAGYAHILNDLYGVYDDVDSIEFDKMPQLFFVKTNHDSGTYALINQKEEKTFSNLEKIRRALARNYYNESREWQYKDIPPKVICEAYIDSKSTCGLIDYRFYCFEGIIGFIAVDIGTTSSSGKHLYGAKRNIYDEDFNYLDVKLKRDHFDASLVEKPANFDEMKSIAISLSKPFKHVRVDLYNVNGRIIFGEMTFCNAGGMQLLEPYEFNLKIGEMIKLKENANE